MLNTSNFITPLLRIHLFEEQTIQESPTTIYQKDWEALFQLAQQQGVLAIIWDAICTLANEEELTPDQMPDKALKLQWALRAEKIESRYNKQKMLAEKLSGAFAESGINTYVLKGLAISSYYPTPEHRECGDLDCFLASVADNGEFVPRYEDGNVIAEKIGAEVERDYYKHSHINFKGLMVENHAFCTAVRGSKERKEFERHLQKLLATKPSTPIDGTVLRRPCADFNALFLTAHGMGHFISEGIKLRHIIDWALLLKAEQDNIDWTEFYRWSDKMNMTRFANALTAISVKYLGLVVTNPAIQTTSPYAERILEDTLYHSEGIHNKGYTKLVSRVKLIQNRLSYIWKYHMIYQKSMLLDIARSCIAFIFEKNPRL